MTDLHDHEPTQFYWDAETEHCPHKPIPERYTDAWDQWMTLGHQPYDDGILCLAAPAEIGCPACSAESGEMVPWDRCENRTYGRPAAEDPQHKPITVLGGGLECVERECEDYFTDDGDEKPGVDTCSHLHEEEVCEGCSVETPDGDFVPLVLWKDCPRRAVTAGAQR